MNPRKGVFCYGDAMKTMFAIYLMEDDNGFVRVSADHYGPGHNSYELGVELLMHLKSCEMENPQDLKVGGLFYASKLQ